MPFLAYPKTRTYKSSRIGLTPQGIFFMYQQHTDIIATSS